MKYRNVKTNGYDSKKEAKRAFELKAMEKVGLISDLKEQVPFVLIPAQKKDGKTIERPVIYKADFVYTKDGGTIVEDSKGMRTKDYIIKRKLMLHVWGIRILET